jgi:hypothetical protein
MILKQKTEEGNKDAHAPLLELDLGVVRACLRGDELLEVADGVVWAALYAHCKTG